MNVRLCPGTYYVGDVGSVLPWVVKHGIQNGKYQIEDKYTDIREFAIGHTSYPNGIYQGSNGFGYKVKNNNIGLVHEHLLTSERRAYVELCHQGTFHTFDNVITFECVDGIFTISSRNFHLTIDTRR